MFRYGLVVLLSCVTIKVSAERLIPMNLAWAYSPTCPTVAGNLSWREYFKPVAFGEPEKLFAVNFLSFYGENNTGGWAEPVWGNNLLGGSTYNMTLGPEGWYAMGPVKSAGCVGRHTAKGGAGTDGKFTIFTELLSFDDFGNVYAQGVATNGGPGLVGQLSCFWKDPLDPSQMNISPAITSLQFCD